MPKLTFRPFAPTDADYEAAVAIHNAALPDYPETVEDWHHWDEHRPSFCAWERWMAEANGRVVGTGFFGNSASSFHPQKFYLEVMVHPEAQGQGVAQALYAHLQERLRPHNPINLRCEARQDFAAANHLLNKFGYREEMRFWESRLDVQAFDPTPFAGAEERALSAGYTIATLREFMQQGEGYRRELYAAITEMAEDVPRADVFTPVPYDDWERAHVSDPTMLPEGYFLALHNGRIAAVSQLWTGAEADVLYVGLTATRREHRRKGLALALKLRTLAFAKTRGTREIRTGNETRNRPMLAINEALGFVKQPVWVAYVKEL